MIDLNDDLPEWAEMLKEAENNASTDFEIEFCESLREKLRKYGENAKLTDAQEYKLSCIAQGGDFWEREESRW